MKKQFKIKSLHGSYKILINKTMLSYCLKCRKKWEIKARVLQRQTKENQCFYQNVPCFIKSLEPEFTYSACGPFTKNKERIQKFKETKKQEIQSTFIKMNWIKPTFNIIWLVKILRICLKEQLLIKYYVIRHLILLQVFISRR